MKIVLQKWPSVHLVLVGGGPLTEDLIALAEAQELPRMIADHGVRNDVEKILQVRCLQFYLLFLKVFHHCLKLRLLESLRLLVV